MWAVSSKSEQRAHRPDDGPLLRWMLSFEGRRFRRSCHIKMRIFMGTAIFQMSLKCLRGVPWQSFLYKEENLPEGSKAREIMSCPSNSCVPAISVIRSARSLRSRVPKPRRNAGFPPIARKHLDTMICGSAAMEKSAGNREHKGPDPCHQSLQKRVEDPLHTWCLAPKRNTDLIFWIAFQNWEPAW
jgi:hypothetical protein